MRRFGLFSSFLNPKQAETKPKPKDSVLIPSIERENSSPIIQVTKFSNSVKVLTESEVFPSTVQIGAVFKSGTRNSTVQSSEILQSIQNSYLLNLEKPYTKELSLIGSDISMSFDQELTSFTASSLSQDTAKLSKILFSIILKRNIEKTFTKDSHFHHFQHKNIENYAESLILQNSLTEGLESPIIKEKPSKVSLSDINNYLTKHHNSDNLYIFATGVYNHHEFVEMVSPYLSKLPQISSEKWKKSQFIPFDKKYSIDAAFYHYSLVFEGCSLDDKDLPVLQIIKTIIGKNSLNSRIFKTIEKSKILSQVYSNLWSFSDVGVFSINSYATQHNSKKVFESLQEVLNDLRNLTDDELAKAKKQRKIDVLIGLENTSKRIEEILRIYALVDRVFEQKHQIVAIDLLTVDRVKAVVEKLLKSPASYLCLGRV